MFSSEVLPLFLLLLLGVCNKTRPLVKLCFRQQAWSEMRRELERQKGCSEAAFRVEGWLRKWFSLAIYWFVACETQPHTAHPHDARIIAAYSCFVLLFSSVSCIVLAPWRHHMLLKKESLPERQAHESCSIMNCASRFEIKRTQSCIHASPDDV